jgi:hypothetical protein
VPDDGRRFYFTKIQRHAQKADKVEKIDAVEKSSTIHNFFIGVLRPILKISGMILLFVCSVKPRVSQFLAMIAGPAGDMNRQNPPASVR